MPDLIPTYSVFVYPALIEMSDPIASPNEYLVSFRDVPEAITGGSSLSESLDLAVDALAIAIDGYLVEGRPVPEPSPARPGEHLVPLSLDVAARAVLIGEMARQSISGRALAERMARDEKNVRRILAGAASLDLTLEALQALGVRPTLSVQPRPAEPLLAA